MHSILHCPHPEHLICAKRPMNTSCAMCESSFAGPCYHKDSSVCWLISIMVDRSAGYHYQPFGRIWVGNYNVTTLQCVFYNTSIRRLVRNNVDYNLTIALRNLPKNNKPYVRRIRLHVATNPANRTPLTRQTGCKLRLATNDSAMRIIMCLPLWHRLPKHRSSWSDCVRIIK